MAENERTLVFVKPQNEAVAYNVFNYLNYLLSKDLRAFQKFGLTWELNGVPEFLIGRHYFFLRNIDELIFSRTIEAYKTGKIFLSFYEGDNIINRVRGKIGHTDPQKAEDWTVRGRFRTDSLEDALREKRYLNNVIHASANSEEARRELSIWMPFLTNL
jgi:nucleoside-diphosphate kinase